MNAWVARNVMMRAQERLLGRRTFRFYRQLRESQWYPPQRLRDLQLLKLQQRIASALNDTPFYAELAGVEPSWRPRDLQDLQRLPLLDKATLAAHREKLVNRNVPGGAILYNTGGSTGQPLTFYLDRRRQAYDKAARMLTHQWWGVLPGEREAYVWGSPVELSKQDRLKGLRDWLTNDRLLSAFELSPQTIGDFVRRLRRFRPACLFGYPSSIAVMCELARRVDVDLAGLAPKAVFCTAEVLYDHQRRAISRALGGVPVVNGYGSREGGFISHECPSGGMHIISENVIVEFIADGRPVPAGQDGEIVVTHLDNFAMPFIRYRTGDVGQRSDEACPCGRGTELMKVIKGRACDFIVTADGRWLHPLAMIYLVRDIEDLRQYQIVQEHTHRIRFRLVMEGQLPQQVLERIRRDVERRMNHPVEVIFEFPPGIPLSASGKFRNVISLVAADRHMTACLTPQAD